MTAVDSKTLAQEIDQYVRPETFPVAIRVYRDEAALPPRVRRPWRDMGLKITICQAVGMAWRYGWTVGAGGEDLSCPIAMVAFGFEAEIDYYKEGNLAAGMYVETCELGALTEAEMPRFSREEAGIVVCAPLARAPFEPEVVCAYGNSAQVMRMAAAALWKTGGSITTTTTCRADCADIVIRTLRADRPQVILPCYGDRVFAQTQDHEMAFSFPWRLAADLVEGLRGTHQGGVRYPVPHYLRYEAQFPATYEKLKELWQKDR